MQNSAGLPSRHCRSATVLLRRRWQRKVANHILADVEPSGALDPRSYDAAEHYCRWVVPYLIEALHNVSKRARGAGTARQIGQCRTGCHIRSHFNP